VAVPCAHHPRPAFLRSGAAVRVPPAKARHALDEKDGQPGAVDVEAHGDIKVSAELAAEVRDGLPLTQATRLDDDRLSSPAKTLERMAYPTPETSLKWIHGPAPYSDQRFTAGGPRGMRPR